MKNIHYNKIKSLIAIGMVMYFAFLCPLLITLFHKQPVKIHPDDIS